MPYEGDPANLLTDEVRFLLGDTDTVSPHLSDDEVDYLLTTHGTAVKAAYNGALTLAAKFAAKQDISVGTASLRYGEMVTRFKELATTLADRGGDSGVSVTKVGAPVAGGLAGDTRSDGTTITMWSDVDWSVGTLSEETTG